jgi:xanthine dehydrogenase accessory factor
VRDVIEEIKEWIQADDPVALATVIRTWGSAPRPAGSRMAVSRSGKIAGSVSGGCLEGEVFERAQEVLNGRPAALFHYGVSDDLAWSVGLSCGGELDILVEPLGDVHRALVGALDAQTPVVLSTDLGRQPGARRLLTSSDPEAARLLQSESPEFRDDWFLEPFPRLPELLIFGGAHVAIPLVTLARQVGFRVTVVDARSKFAGGDRFPGAERVIHDWPDQALERMTIDSSSYIVLLTHDPKFDDPTIKAALRGNARYIGVLGSRRTHRERVARLIEAGVRSEDLERLHAPIGLDLGGRTAEETALAILAEMVAVRHGKSGGHLAG